MTRNGALAGMLTGAVTVVLWKNWIDPAIGRALADPALVNLADAKLGLYEIIPGFILGTLAILIFSRIGQPASASMQARFDKAEQQFKDAHI